MRWQTQASPTGCCADASPAYSLPPLLTLTLTLMSHLLLLQEVADSSPANRPLRRRIVVLVSQWVARIASEDRPAVYRMLLHVMAENDLCLQVSYVLSFSPCGHVSDGMSFP